MSAATRGLLLLAVLCAARAPHAEEVEVGDAVIVVRTDGRKVKGVLAELTDTHVTVRLRFGSVNVALEEVAETKLDPKAAKPEEGGGGTRPPAIPAAPGKAEELLERVLDLMEERELLDALKAYDQLMASTANPFLKETELHREILEDADVHSQVRDLDTLGELVEILAGRSCNRCGGPGELRCKNCKGKGKSLCDLCKGRGLSKCGKCKGKGKEKCPKCQGSARMDCDDCGVNDNVCCSHGKRAKLGKLRRYRPGEGNTPVNNRGHGRSVYVDCPECTNAGKDTCDTCEANSRGVASGHVSCKRCRGEKKLKCQRCGGREYTGACTVCRGDKSEPCRTCEGTGLNEEARRDDEEDR